MKIVSALVSPRGAVFLLLAVLLIAITVLNPNFAEPGQLMRFIQRVAPVAIVAIGQYFVIVGGDWRQHTGAARRVKAQDWIDDLGENQLAVNRRLERG